MQKISIKREQSQAGLSFAEREKFRPQVKNKLLLLLALLLTAVTGAWAQEPATTYSVKMKDGTQDAKNWTITSGEKSAKGDAADGLTGLSEKDAVTLQYNGRLKVKGVTATSDAAPAKEPATVTTAPTGAAIVGVGKTTALVSGGVADGGTLMYAVTTTDTKPASTDGFSDAVPTAKDITASGTVYVWYYVKGDDTHSDSEIAATAIEVPVADIVWDVTNVSGLMLFGNSDSNTIDDVTLNCIGENQYAVWMDNGDPKYDGIVFEMMESGGFTFTAPDGKAFTKIVMKASGPEGWYNANEYESLGMGWAFNFDVYTEISTVTWTGGAASPVSLLTGATDFHGQTISYIAFYLSK
jgi:hypothetical protein